MYTKNGQTNYAKGSHDKWMECYMPHGVDTKAHFYVQIVKYNIFRFIFDRNADDILLFVKAP